jgi:hypothetical protein
VAGLADSGDEPSREPPEELAEWEADDGGEFFSWELPAELLVGELLPGELLVEEPLVEAVARDPDEAECFFEEPELEEDVPEDRVPEEEELFFFAEELPEEDFFAEELVEEPEELWWLLRKSAFFCSAVSSARRECMPTPLHTSRIRSSLTNSFRDAAEGNTFMRLPAGVRRSSRGQGDGERAFLPPWP